MLFALVSSWNARSSLCTLLLTWGAVSQGVKPRSPRVEYLFHTGFNVGAVSQGDQTAVSNIYMEDYAVVAQEQPKGPS